MQSNPYGLKESGPPGADMGAWTSAGLQPTTGYYPYDPALAAYGYVPYVMMAIKCRYFFLLILRLYSVPFLTL